MASVNFDKVLDEVGVCGRYQVRMVALISLPIMYSAMFGLNFYFTKMPVAQRCFISECDDKKDPTYDSPWLDNSIPYDENMQRPSQCERFKSVEHGNSSNSTDNNIICPAESFDRNKTIECEKYIFKDPDITIATQMLNHCNDSKKLELIGQIAYLGMFFGNGITGLIQDRIGRRHGLVLAILVSSFLGMMKSFSSNFNMYLTFEFLNSMVAGGIYSAGFILGIEMVGQRNRVLVAMLFSSFYSMGEILLATMALVLRHWQDLLRGIYIPPLFFIGYLWLLPESVRWLSCKGKLRKARKGLRIMAEENGVDLNEAQLKDMIVEAAGSYSAIFKSKRLMSRFLISGIVWFVSTLVLLDLTVHSLVIENNQYVEFIYFAMVELPAILTTYLLLFCMGRRNVVVISLVMTGAAMMTPAFLPDGNEHLAIHLAVYVLGRFVSNIALNVLFLFTTEMFPTPQRGLIIGMSLQFSRLAGVLLPLVKTEYMDWMPRVIFLVTTLMAAALMFLLPETRHSRLPDTIEEAENIGKKPLVVPEQPLFPEQPSEE